MKPMMSIKLCALWLLANFCWLAAEEMPRRGVNLSDQPWAFRTVLDGRPRVLVAALDDSLWAAWDTQRCRLFQVWKPGAEGVKLQGAVHDGAHGPQPVSDGSRYHQEPAEAAWFVLDQDRPIAVEVKYRNFRTGKPGELTLTYLLQLGHTQHFATVQETPSLASGDVACLKRTFIVSGLTSGQKILLKLAGDSSRWSLSGDAGELQSIAGSFYLSIRGNGAITLVGTWDQH